MRRLVRMGARNVLRVLCGCVECSRVAFVCAQRSDAMLQLLVKLYPHCRILGTFSTNRAQVHRANLYFSHFSQCRHVAIKCRALFDIVALYKYSLIPFRRNMGTFW